MINKHWFYIISMVGGSHFSKGVILCVFLWKGSSSTSAKKLFHICNLYNSKFELSFWLAKAFCRKTVKLEQDVAFHWQSGRKWLVFATMSDGWAKLGQLSGHTNNLRNVRSAFCCALPLWILKTALQDFPSRQYLQGERIGKKMKDGWTKGAGLPNY